jgi:hypothetical protein
MSLWQEGRMDRVKKWKEPIAKEGQSLRRAMSALAWVMLMLASGLSWAQPDGQPQQIQADSSPSQRPRSKPWVNAEAGGAQRTDADCPTGVDPTYCQWAKATGGAVVACDLTTPESSARCSKRLVEADQESRRREVEQSRARLDPKERALMDARAQEQERESLVRTQWLLALEAWVVASVVVIVIWARSAGREPSPMLHRDMGLGLWVGVGCILLWGQEAALLEQALSSWVMALFMCAPAMTSLVSSRMLSSVGMAPAAKAVLLLCGSLSGSFLWLLVGLSHMH